MAKSFSEDVNQTNNKGRYPSWVAHLTLGFAVPVFVLLLPWMQLDEKYTMLEFFKLVGESNGIVEYAKQFEADVAFVLVNYYAMWAVAVGAVAMFIKGVAGIFGKKLSTIGLLIYFGFFLYIPIFAYLAIFAPCIGMELTLIAVLLDMVLGVYLDQREYIKAEAKARRERDRAAKAEKKRRMNFEGKYDKDFALIIFKNFKANIKNYMLFFFSAMVTMILLVVVLGLQSSMGGASATGNYYQKTVMKEVNQVLPIVVVLSLLIIAMTITYYIRSCVESYSIYDLLGIRRSTLKIIIITEYLICIFFSMIIGLMVGELVLRSNTGEFTTATITLISVLLYLIIIGLASLINIHVFQYSDIMKLSYPVLGERIPRRFAKLIAPIGLVVMAIPMIKFPNPSNYESLILILVELVGSYIAIYFDGSVIVNWKVKAANRDELKLLGVLDWRYRFRTNIRFVIIIFTLNFLALSVCIPKLAANSLGASADELAPYDRVLLTYDDDSSDVAKLLKSQGVSASEYEILRATTPLGDEVSIFLRGYNGVLWPQGQHIIISQSEYERLCRERGIAPDKLSLEGKPKDTDKISEGEKSEHLAHILIQQDASVGGHKLEWYAGSNNRFKLGQPVEYYAFNEREQIFKDHEATYNRQILIGSLRGGTQENLIVVSDDYFRSIYDTKAVSMQDASPVDEIGMPVTNELAFEDVKEGPTHMYLINYGDGADEKALDEGLKSIADRHEDDRRLNSSVEGFYNAEQNAKWNVHLRNENSVLNAGMIAAFLATSVLMMGIKYLLGMEDKKRQYKMLSTLGMRRKDMKRLYNSETGMLIWGSYFTALITSLPFVLGVMRTRMMSGMEMHAYVSAVGIILVMYSAVYAVSSIVIRNALRRV